MELGMIGLGRMGLNMALRLLRGGHRVAVWNRAAPPVAVATGAGAEEAREVADFARLLRRPRVVWLMLPAGAVTEEYVRRLLDVLDAGDVIVDGANSRYTDTVRLAGEVEAGGLHYVDAGVSGGIWGLEGGYSLMVGGDEEAVGRLVPALKTLAPDEDRGWGHVGPVGSGHFVKMVHNGIEYGMMQAFAEGFALLEAKQAMGERGGEPVAVALDLHQIAELWRHGSVVRSWLLDLAAGALAARPALEGVAPWVPDSGEGRWTVEEAVALRVPAPVITAALFERFQSRNERAFAYRLLSALRGGFGGHPVRGDPGTPGLHPDGTLDVIPGGPDTEGARTVPGEHGG
jgi:6-phosphogluconate dehydrogenase